MVTTRADYPRCCLKGLESLQEFIGNLTGFTDDALSR